jgi:thioredoxin reductase
VNPSAVHVAVVGAGPYGIAAVAHLRASGIETCIFGKPMEFWERNMPKGMLLRSLWDASHISDPHGALTLDRFESARGEAVPTRIPLGDYVDYGKWVQAHVAPDVDRRRVVRVDRQRGSFTLELEDGETVRARHVIVATGIKPFAWRPSVAEGLPEELVSHTAEHSGFDNFKGRRVVVIGGGQSALESAALLSEAGASVELIARKAEIRWLRSEAAFRRSELGFVKRVLYPPFGLGPPPMNYFIAEPSLFSPLPRSLKDWMADYAAGPAGGPWLIPRLNGVRLTTGRHVTAATSDGGRALRLTLDDGSNRGADHMILATGYRVDVARYSFLAEDLAQAVRGGTGHPRLREGFESRVPGLHFIGGASTHSFGPLFRFVSGTEYTARALCHLIGRNGLSRSDRG